MSMKKTILIALFLCLAGSMTCLADIITVHEDDFEDREIGSTTEGWLWNDNAASHEGLYADFEGSIVRQHTGTLNSDINQRFGYKTDIEMTGNTSEDPADYTIELDIRNLQGEWDPHEIEIWVLTYNSDAGGSTYGFGLPLLELYQEDEWVHIEYNLGDLVELNRTWWEGTDWDMTDSTWAYEIGGPPYPGVEVSGASWTQVFLVDNLKITMSAEPPEFAKEPVPEDQSIEVLRDVILSWTPGDFADNHNVYFGTDANDVNEASLDDPRGVLVSEGQVDASYDPGLLDWDQTYYWRIDEVNEAEPNSPWKSKLWSFTTRNFVAVDDFEDYNDYEPDRIFDAWVDGYGVTTNGSTVGYAEPDFVAGEHFVETTIVYGGSQSMPYFYDNTVAGNSEVTLTLVDPTDWTYEDVETLSLWFQGYPPYLGSFTEGPAGTYTMTATGADIWETADEFHFAYKQLTGVGSIIAKVESVENTNGWAKAGVMIRNTLEPGSRHAMVVVTPEQGVSFQRRTIVDSDSSGTTETDVTAPIWVKIDRDISGNFTASYSSDGASWTHIGVDSINMNATAYVGLALTSHNTEEVCEAVFSNVTITGNVSQEPWMDQDIGILSNGPEPIYVVLDESAVVYHEDPNASTINEWTEWRINLQQFADQGIDLTNVESIGIGFGDRNNPQPGGAGLAYFDNIRLYRQQTP
ncbi:MAG: hypothetical protein PVH77_07040 [Phycisphaerales bacterium]|jgi:hypothetical protein